MNHTVHIAVLIPIRDRYDYRIKNCLESLKGQSASHDSFEVILLDYGSHIKHKSSFETLVSQYSIRGIWTDVQNEWNKSHCLNIGIRQTDATHIQVCDTDIIFAPNYIETCIENLRQHFQQMLYCRMMDTSEGLIDGPISYPDEYTALLESSVYRGDRLGDVAGRWPFGSSILCTSRQMLVDIGGYDEFYKLWGDEDWDMVERLLAAGAPLVDMSQQTSHIHQWHPRFERVGTLAGFEEQVAANREYFLSKKGIVRNDGQWGRM